MRTARRRRSPLPLRLVLLLLLSRARLSDAVRRGAAARLALAEFGPEALRDPSERDEGEYCGLQRVRDEELPDGVHRSSNRGVNGKRGVPGGGLCG